MRNFFIRPFILLLTCSIILGLQVKAQNMAINNTGATANSAALLDVDASGLNPKKGLLIPRVTLAQKTAMSPLPVAAQGLTVYQTDGVEGYYFNTSTTVTPSWQYMTTSATGWNTNGNTLTGTLPASPAEWIGSINNADMVFRTNNTERIRISNTGSVGIGTSTPGKNLDVNGAIRLADHFIYNSANAVINWGNTGHLYFRTNPTIGDETSFTDRMILSNQGYLGINTGIPVAPLQINQPFNLSAPMVYLSQTSGTWGTVSNFNSYRYIQTNYTGPGSEYKQFNVGGGGVSIGYSNVPLYGSNDALYINGNVGIGTISPATTLDVRGANGLITVGTTGGTGGGLYLGNSNHGLQRGFPTLNADNNVGLMTTSGNIYLSTNGNSTGEFVLTDDGRVSIGSAPVFPEKLHVRYDNNSGWVASLYNAGNNNTVQNNGLVIGAGHLTYTGTSSAFLGFFVPTGPFIGNISQVSSNSVAYNTTSDERLKTKMIPTRYGLDILKQIEVIDYFYKNDDRTPQTGFKAQQLYTKYPFAVSPGGDDPKTQPWMMDYGKMSPLVVKSIQEQQAQIDALKADNDKLNKENIFFKTEIEQIKEKLNRLLKKEKQLL